MKKYLILVAVMLFSVAAFPLNHFYYGTFNRIVIDPNNGDPKATVTCTGGPSRCAVLTYDDDTKKFESAKIWLTLSQPVVYTDDDFETVNVVYVTE